MGVKIGIEGDNRSAFHSRPAKDLFVERLGHSDFAGMDRVNPGTAEKGSGSARRALVEKQFHWPSCAGSQLDHFVVQIGRCVSQRLAHVFVLKLRVFSPQVIAVRVGGHSFDHAAHGETKITNARLAVHPPGVAGDAREGHG